MIHSLRQLLNDQRGSQAIEFLLMLPLVLLLLLCLADFGKAAYYKIVLQSAVRDGARIAALDAPQADVEQTIRRSAGNVSVDEIEIVQVAVPERGEWAKHTGVQVKISSCLRLQGLLKMALPERRGELRLEAKTQVPLVR